MEISKGFLTAYLMGMSLLEVKNLKKIKKFLKISFNRSRMAKF